MPVVAGASLAFAISASGPAILRLAGSPAYRRLDVIAVALREASTLGLSLVFAMLPALMYARRSAPRWNATAVRILIAGVVMSIVFIGWIGPMAFAASFDLHGPRFAGPQPAFEPLDVVAVAAWSAPVPERVIWQHVLAGRLALIVTAWLLGVIGWRLAATPPSPRRAAFWWFLFMEFTLASGSYARESAVWVEWRGPLVLVIALIALAAAPGPAGRSRAPV